MSVYIVYPECRVVSDEQIRVWFSDAVANGKVAWVRPKLLSSVGIGDMVHVLSDAGIITLGRPA